MNRGKVYSVSSVNQYIKNMFSQEYALSVVFVKGEVSNCKYHSSGHIYFTLKDRDSQLACVMFRGDRRGLGFTMQNGQMVTVSGSISVYERDGKYQLYAKKIVESGDGILAEQFEKLKKELQEAGYFDTDRKLPIPAYAKRIGIVTASTSAALQDMIQISKRRNPYVQLILYPAIVQGKEAAGSIVAGIRRLDKEQVDVIIVGRGGGSMEDLWAFNERSVADAIYECRTPVISAVGHETDFTIADFVSDLRAPTPSAAAELAAYNVRSVLEQLENQKGRLCFCMKRSLVHSRDYLRVRETKLQNYNPTYRMREFRSYLLSMEDRLELLMKQTLQKKKYAFSILCERLDSASPLKKLQSGYGHVADVSGNTITSVDSVQKDDKLFVTLQDGTIETKVIEVKEKQEKILGGSL